MGPVRRGQQKYQHIDGTLRLQQNSAPKKNTVFARYIFQERKQEDEPFDSFITDLRNPVKDCH